VEQDACGVDHRAQAGLRQRMEPSADRFHQLVKGWGRFALGDVEPNLLQMQAHHPEHKGPGIDLLEELEALIGDEPINAGEVTKIAIHFDPGSNVAYAQLRVKRGALDRDISIVI